MLQRMGPKICGNGDQGYCIFGRDTIERRYCLDNQTSGSSRLIKTKGFGGMEVCAPKEEPGVEEREECLTLCLLVMCPREKRNNPQSMNSVHELHQQICTYSITLLP